MVQLLNNIWHYYCNVDVARMPRMDCGAMLLNLGAGEKQQTYHGEVQRGDLTSAQMRELGQQP